MFAVIFEAQPHAEEMDTYLQLAKFLRPELEQIEGFIANERFTSQTTTGRILSLSTWRDEKALIRWRTLGVHHGVQKQGRARVFADYHLRVGEFISDSWTPDGQGLTQERFDTTVVGAAQFVTLTETAPGAASAPPDLCDGAAGLVDWERYDSITTPGKGLLLAAWRDEAALAAWDTQRPDAASTERDPTVRQRAVRIIRDYGMRERREAPQYYAPVAPLPVSAPGVALEKDTPA